MECEKHPGFCSLIWRVVEHRLAEQLDIATGDFVFGRAEQGVAERRFAASIRPHNCVNFAGKNGEVKPSKDFAS